MLHFSTVLLVVAKTMTLAFGAVLTTLTFRAYRRTRSAAMGVLCLGLGLVTAGSVLAGSLHQLLGVPLTTSTTIESLFMAAGLGVLTYSLYAKRLNEI